MKSKSIFLIAISLGFGLVAAIGITQVMGKKTETNQPVEIKKSSVIIAKDDLGIGKTLTSDMFIVEEWPEDIIPEGVITDLAELEKQPMVNISRIGKRGPVYLKDIVPETEYKPFNIPKGYKVFGVNLNADDTIYGLLQPGDMIDLIAVFDGRGQAGRPSSRTFMRKIAVYSVASKTDRDIEREGTGKSKTVVGLLVTEQQAEEIAIVQAAAELRIVMRSQEDANEDLAQYTVPEDDEESKKDGKSALSSLSNMFGMGGKPDKPQDPPRSAGHIMTIHNGEDTVRFRFENGVAHQIKEGRPAPPVRDLNAPPKSMPAGPVDSEGNEDFEDFDSFNGELDSEPQI